ncbi:hypothetical protein J7J18_06760 [bacterium]|nr:hypothetical protein [bacterium]
MKGYLLGDERYFDVPLVRPGLLFCRYLKLSLNQLLKRGFTPELREFIQECHQLSGGDAFYILTRKEGSNIFLITPIDNLQTRVQPYLFINGYFLCEFTNFASHVVLGGAYAASK